MTRVSYDLHIHSCLSPCADNEMTPNNIVNMSVLKELDVIAVTDHNSCKNCDAVIKAAAGRKLIVLPGMELQTSEDIHILCLFSNLYDALAFEKDACRKLLKIKNKPELFGEQLIMNEYDEVTGKEDDLLIVSSGISSDKVSFLADKYNGIAIPAHIDREANSILMTLGAITDEMGFYSLEVSENYDYNKLFNEYPYLKNKYKFIYNSDAHYLGDISERVNFVDIKEVSAQSVIDCLKCNKIL